MDDFKKLLTVDKDNLDLALVEQASLMYDYGLEYAEALRKRDKLKDRLDVVKAELDSEIRSNPEGFGFDKKPTESAIANAILLEKEYRAASERYLEACYEVNVILAAKNALEHKKSAVENLIKLYCSNYWAEGTSLPAEDRQQIKKEASDIRSEQARKGMKSPRLKRNKDD